MAVTSWTRRILLASGLAARSAKGACIPDVPTRLLADPLVLQHPSVLEAFEKMERNLSALYNTSRDGLSFAVVSRT